MAKLLLNVQVASLLLMALGLLVQRHHLLGFRPSFVIFGAGVALSVVVGIVAVLVFLLSFVAVVPPSVRLEALMAATVAGGVFFCVLGLVGPEGLRAPPIHDISTDLDSPPDFLRAPTLRGTHDHRLGSPSADALARQRKAYPDIAPLYLDAAPGAVLARAEALARQWGWNIVLADHERGRLEAVVESALFRFRDDIVVLVTASGAGSRVDMRSASRVGKSDLGANAARIRTFLRALEKERGI